MAHQMCNQRRRDDAGPAGERLVLDAALVGADDERRRLGDLDEIDVCAAREDWAAADGAALRDDVGLLGVGHEDDGVWHAGVHEMILDLAPAEVGALVELCVGWRGQVDADVVANVFRGDEAGGRGEVDALGIGAAQGMDEAGEAAGAVAAHLGFATVGIIIAHAEIGVGAVGGFNREHAVGPDAEMAVAKPLDLRGGQRAIERAVVDDNEVVAGAAHLHKGEGYP